jgi:hypothetical protein
MIEYLGPINVMGSPTRQKWPRRSLISRRRIRQGLGVFWLLAGLLQLQPSMFTANLVTGIMQPVTQGQPGLVVDTIQPIINLTAHFLVPVNLMIVVIQLTLGVCLLRGWWVRPVILGSIAWAFAVWYGGEGIGLILTGQASALTGAPGAVLLYALVGAIAFPVDQTKDSGKIGAHLRHLLAVCHPQRFLAGFWVLAAVLQLQPYWWQSHQISQAIAAMEGQGTLNGAIVGPSLSWLAGLTSGAEIALNLALIVVFFSLGIGLAVVKTDRVRPLLAGSIVLSLVLWWATEAFGQLLTGTATDVNSAPLLILLALACWPARRLPSITVRVRPTGVHLKFSFHRLAA